MNGLTDLKHGCDKRAKRRHNIKEASAMAGFTLLAVALFAAFQHLSVIL